MADNVNCRVSPTCSSLDILVRLCFVQCSRMKVLAGWLCGVSGFFRRIFDIGSGSWARAF